jgi:hypothetical protein
MLRRGIDGEEQGGRSTDVRWDEPEQQDLLRPRLRDRRGLCTVSEHEMHADVREAFRHDVGVRSHWLNQLCERTVRKFQEKLARHARDAVDPAWSPKTTRSFKDDLAKMTANGGFDVVRVDCRTTSCVSTLSWPSYGAASRSYSQVLVARYQANCSRDVILTPPADLMARHEAQVVFECDRGAP